MEDDNPNLVKVPPEAGSIAPTAMSMLETTRCDMTRRRQKTQALYIAPPIRVTVPNILKKGVRILTPWGIAALERLDSVLRSILAVKTLKMA